jgi:hypothetical protein
MDMDGVQPEYHISAKDDTPIERGFAVVVRTLAYTLGHPQRIEQWH